ncbi:hypothetical protein OsI_35782 [Oryza sativa Indica Group]|uniref:Uncharacterized protein n=1 Tax=Oryza sativa subsp. indica TaxID=39946 RepID=B8BK12_ORYSI|nr:hypothetical protein OsI_35782 [Oryza sativa Indica Group]
MESSLFSPVTSQALTTARRCGWRSSHRFAPAMVCASTTLSRSVCSSERGCAGGAAHGLSLEDGGSWRAGSGKLPRQLVPAQGLLCCSWRRDAAVEEDPWWWQPAGGTQAWALFPMAWAMAVLGLLGANGPVRPTALAWATALTQPAQVCTAQLTFPFLLCLNPSVQFLGVTWPAPKPTPPYLCITSRHRLPPCRATPAGSGSGFGKEMSKLLSMLVMFWTLLGGRDKRLLFVLYKVPIAEHPPSQDKDSKDSLARTPRRRVEEELKAGKCARVALKDFDRLKDLYGINWRREHLKIFCHRKRDVHAMLYRNWKEIDSGTRAYLDEENISYDSERFPTVYEGPFFIEGKSANGHTVRCYFVDAGDIDGFFSARIVPNEPPN